MLFNLSSLLLLAFGLLSSFSSSSTSGTSVTRASLSTLLGGRLGIFFIIIVTVIIITIITETSHIIIVTFSQTEVVLKVVGDDFFLYGDSDISVNIQSFQLFITFAFFFIVVSTSGSRNGSEEVEERVSIDFLFNGSDLSSLLILLLLGDLLFW